MEAGSSTEAPLSIYEATQHYIAVDSNIHTVFMIGNVFLSGPVEVRVFLRAKKLPAAIYHVLMQPCSVH
jgi:hypothetical protein